mmetsp:Transcript_2339/g.6532  ORF Transcript_2339/g.6532 Transcript_2339/m.6532 type:complete len:426 (+) Transcript_2339:75-1352(+)
MGSASVRNLVFLTLVVAAFLLSSQLMAGNDMESSEPLKLSMAGKVWASPTRWPAPTLRGCEDYVPQGADPNFSCLQQALWGKCEAHFMGMGTCDRSCGRCSSALRAQAFRRTLLVSARQSSPCTDAGADAWVMRAMANKAEYARMHGMSLTWHAELFRRDYDGAWNKVVILHKTIQQLLAQHRGRGPALGGAKAVDWVLWCDWDVIFTDLAFEIPLEEYELRDVHLVVGGDPAGVLGAQADYLKINSGVLLLRVSNFTVALLERILSFGRPASRRKHALVLQRSIRNLCRGCIDDQAVLLHLLHDEPQRWAAKTVLERRYLLQTHWEDIIDAMPLELAPRPPAQSVWHPLRPLSAEPLPPLSRAFFGLTQVPLAVHFAGCQLCSGKAPVRAVKCWPAFRGVVRFSEQQSLRHWDVHPLSQNQTTL